jgi:dihydroorotate dehydrogenase (NAD+) catalytic subunit
MAGASCVQVGTANFAEPSAALRVRDELAALVDELRIGSVAEIVGCIEKKLPPEPPWKDRSPWT